MITRQRSISAKRFAIQVGEPEKVILQALADGLIGCEPRKSNREMFRIPVGEVERWNRGRARSLGEEERLAYQSISALISQVPDSFARDLEQRLDFFRAQALALAHLLSAFEHHPYRFWGEIFADIGESLAGFLSSDALAAIERRGDPVRLRPVFDRDTSRLLQRIRASAAAADDTTTENLRQLRDLLRKWNQFASTWEVFRDAAEKCFDPAGTVSRYTAGSRGQARYSELIHSSEVLVRDDRTGKSINWNATIDLSSRPEVIDRVTDFIAEAVKGLDWDFDTVCQLSSGAHGLALLLGLKLGKRHLAMDNVTLNFLPEKVGDDLGRNLVLIDMVVQSGRHLGEAKERLERDGRRFRGAIFVVMNDCLLKPADRRSIIDELISSDQLIHCFRLSEFLPRLP